MTTSITFSLREAGVARLELFNAQGRRVEVLLPGVLPEGRNRIDWDAGPLPAWVYLYRLRAGDEIHNDTPIRIR